MYQFFFTNFIRNRTIQFSISVSMLFDFSLSQSIKHTLILFGLPYITSIIMAYRLKPTKSKLKARISEQYRNK